MSILNKYKRWKSNCLLDKSRYYDFVLSLDNSKTVNVSNVLTERCLVSYIDIENSGETITENGIVSIDKYNYELSVNNGGELKNIGLTGTDNGLISFDKNTITEQEYINLATGTTLNIKSGDTRLILNKVSGNTQNYNYDCELINSGETYYKFNGGFLQGFYKLDDVEYQVLPQYINGAWNLEFVIRPRFDYESSGNTLNNRYPNNKGIFFYMGTRAENKFTQFYGCDFSDYEKRGINNITTNKYTIKTSESHPVESDNFSEVITDNGYLIYNKTKDGFTTKTWNKEDTLQLIFQNNHFDGNLYTILNKTQSGVTTNTLDEYLQTHSGLTKNDKCSIIKDIENNAFALKIYEDGSVGYKYLIKDCDSESGFAVTEEKTVSNLINPDMWSVVNVMFKILNGETDDCGKPIGTRKMKIYIYVNGYLKLVSKELPELEFRKLNDYTDKQEGVPFNISLGGGTQGLIESTWIDSYNGSEYIFPIEENFAGTFIGDIKSFKFYDCQLQYNEIKNNYLYEMNKKEQEVKVKDNVIYYGFGLTEVDVINNGKTYKANRDKYLRLTSNTSENYQHFYYIVSTKYIGTIAQEFTCGGAPMVMNKETKDIDGKQCYVFKSGAIYPVDTELSIIANQIQ